jgi:nucleoid-associated protein EbfC
MEVKALQQLLSQFRQVQETLQKHVDNVHVEASVGGGMVVIRMNGQKQITDVRIDPEIFAGKDAELLQDLIRAAVNDACRRVDDELAAQMKGLAGGLPGIAGLKIPGLF